MRQRPPNIGRDQVEQLLGLRRVADNPQPAIQEDRADIGGGQEVLEIGIDPAELVDLILQLLVDRVQLLVDRLQLFLAGLQFFGGRMQLFVDRLQLLIRGLQLFDRGFVLLNRGAQLALGML